MNKENFNTMNKITQRSNLNSSRRKKSFTHLMGNCLYDFSMINPNESQVTVRNYTNNAVK